MAPVHVSNHPLVQSRLAALRDQRTEPAEFRRLVRNLSQLMVQEATSDLPTRVIEVRTPLGAACCRVVDTSIAVVPILRAGLGMVEGILELIPEANVYHIGLYRDEATLQPTTYYHRLPRAEDSSIALVVDPMLATGGSAVRACELLEAAGFRSIKVIALIAA